MREHLEMVWYLCSSWVPGMMLMLPVGKQDPRDHGSSCWPWWAGGLRGEGKWLSCAMLLARGPSGEGALSQTSHCLWLPFLGLLVWSFSWCHFCSLSALVSNGLVTTPLLVVQQRLAACPKDVQLSSGWFLALPTMGTEESVLWKHCAVPGPSHSPPWAPALASLGERWVTWTFKSDQQWLLSSFCN